MPFQHIHWQERDTPMGRELCYIPRGGKGFILSFLFSAAVLALSLYGAFIFLSGWFLDHEEILAGGVVLFLIACGGVFLGVHFFAHLFRSTSYTLGHAQLRVMTQKLGKSTEILIDKAGIKEVLQLYTPPTSNQPASSPGWSTCLVYHDMTGQRKEFFLEGMSEEESNHLVDTFSKWADVAHRKENTAE